MSLAPGVIRDSIVDYLALIANDASTEEITAAVRRRVGHVASSSVRSYLNLNTPGAFQRTVRGRYRLQRADTTVTPYTISREIMIGHARLVHADAFEWLAKQPARSIQAVVTDPPYGLVEYSPAEKDKLRGGRGGGVWRVPPSFDGHQRAPLPRFTTLSERDLDRLHAFFGRLAVLLARALVPGANVLVASNPLLSHIVASAMIGGGLELRGYVARQVMTMRGGDRPKNAHEEFTDVTVMPRSQWEPWVILRSPLEGRVQDNLRRWRTGGFRRPSADRPFGDVIASGPTGAAERRIAPHPSLKPRAFMRQIVRAVLPLAEGVVVDPFMGAGSTLAAANAVGYRSIGTEVDTEFFEIASRSVEPLSRLRVREGASAA